MALSFTEKKRIRKSFGRIPEAVQMPNLLQYPIAVFGALRAGLIVVNTNPLYTAREMRHQFKDSGVRGLVYLNTFGKLVQEVLSDTSIEVLVEARIGDMLPALKGLLVNTAVKHLKKMVPAYNIPGMVRFNDALAKGRGQNFTDANPKSEDIAVLQYTGGTTGVAKGAMLTHRNLVANMLQVYANMQQLDSNGQKINGEPGEVIIAPLPLYHIFAFMLSLLGMRSGYTFILVPNPRDMPGFIKTLSKQPFHIFPAVNTLFKGLLDQPNFKDLDFSSLRITQAGGMAATEQTAARWLEVTGCPMAEGWGAVRQTLVNT